MTGTVIHSIRLGITNCYVAGGPGGWVLVDAGIRGRQGRFFRRLAALGLKPADIRLIVVTHAHFDHVGSLAAIADRCRCPVAVHHLEAPILERADIVLPPGTRPASRRLIAFARRHPRQVGRLYAFSPVSVQIRVDREMSLTPYGLDARLLHTPGHTSGSLSLLTDDGHAVVGDLAVNYHPFGLGPIAPPFGDSLAVIRHQWERLLALGARRIHPAHGRAFAASRLERHLASARASSDS